MAYYMRKKTVQTILDVGCGSGEPMGFFKRKGNFFAVGVDIFIPYLRWCKAHNTHDDFVRCDVKFLPFKESSFDLVMSLEVIEHLTKKSAEEMLANFEKIAKFQVIISTPVGKQMQDELDENQYQEHQSGWYPQDLLSLGYAVKGLGFPLIHGLRLTDLLPKQLNLLGHVFWLLSSPIFYSFPSSAGSMICVKTIVSATIMRNRK